MKYTSAVVAALASAQSVAGLMINTPPSLVGCEPVKLDWSADAGTPPYYLSVVPGGQPSAAALKTFPTMQDTSITWLVDIQAGVSVTIALKDNTGATAYTSNLMIQSGPDRSCESTNATPSGVTAASGGAPAATGSMSGAAPSGTPPVSQSGSASASGSARPTGSQAAVASSRPSNAAVAGLSVQSVTGGFASFLAIVGALVF
ncbi:hypothetical protein D9756_003378 [Leucocoprinus leucothites]|uniref:Uncharacterized protein n=1 Tax=Leucocoprinus leucothites TaxID=201217 RepID=A0A8H5G6G1_9AGAR|nr:hypothetical protein D9756_003378 [Leucoagaricus leucothites]